MVMLGRIIYCWLFLSANLLLAEETKEPIPPLPEEIVGQPLAQKEETTEVVFNEEKLDAGVFTNNNFNTGTSRFLNILDLEGYLRVRFGFFHNGHLKTYIPSLQQGTSMMPPNLDIFNRPTTSDDDDDKAHEQNPSQGKFSGNMRLRVNPTIHVSEVVRIKGSVDFFDNMVLGSTPNYLSRGMPNPSWPSSLMSLSQNTPMQGINSWQNAISLKRAYAEAVFPIGELRFGRMPFHWGLGILYNSGDDISNDYGDQIDGVSFTTRIFDHYFTPSYSISYTGPVARGGGFFNSQDFASIYLPTEAGQRYPLESGDLTHVLSLSFLKRESDFIRNKKKQDGRANYDYGIFASYRRQFLDSQVYGYEGMSFSDLTDNIVKRDSHVGLLSLWQSFSVGTFHVEAEAVGVWGKYEIGDKASDLMARNDDGSIIPKRKVWLLQGGVALESKYGFFNDRLQIGLNAGYASSQSGPGFGIREGSKKTPKNGDADGRKLTDDSFKTNFKFNPAYNVDLLLYKEVLGGISGTFYFKPHISYFFSRNFGVRGDVLTALAPDKSNTTGNSNWLGVEVDASTFLRSENGFYFQLQYGILFPLKGLSHQQSVIGTQNHKIFGEAQIAQTLQAYLGVAF